MFFSEYQEELIEKCSNILQKEDNVIVDEFTKFNTIYIGNIAPNKVNVEIQLSYPEMARVIDMDLNRFFKDRMYNFEKTMEYRIWHHSNIPDDMPFIGIYEMDYGVYTMTYSQFGMDTVWLNNDYPAMSRPIVNSQKDFAKLEIPDFFSTGYMPQLIEDYHAFQENLNGKLNVGIRKLFNGFTQFASDIYGIDNFYIDMLEEPKFIQEMFEFFWNYVLEWTSGWEKLHKQPFGMLHLAEDPIDTAYMLHRDMFAEQILPWHIKCGETFNSVHWHSCGKVDNIMEDIKKIPNLELVEIGPTTDAAKASEILKGTRAQFYKCPNVITELLDADDKSRDDLVRNVLIAAENVPTKVLIETPSLEKAMKLLEAFRKGA